MTQCKDDSESHDNMRMFIEQAPSAIAMFDRDMRYLAASRRWIEDYALEGRDIIGKSHYDIFPEIPESWKQVHQRALLGKVVTACEDRFDRSNGTTQWLNWEVRPWYTALKKIGGIVIFTEDITHLRETEHSLQLKIQELKKLMDAVPAAVWIANDPECRVVTGNAVANQIFEASKDENVSPTAVPEARRIFAPDGRELRAEELPMQIAAATNREVRDAELNIEMPSGQSITILGNAVPLRDERGSPIGSIAAFQDISERKKAETLVQESEKRYKSLFDNMLNGFAHCRMLFEDGKPVDFVYLDVNRAFEEQTGLHDIEGKKVTEVIPGIREQSPELFEVYGRVALGCGPEYFETYVEPLHDWYSISVYSAEPGHFVAVFDVITERKKAEVDLRIAAKAFDSLNGIMVTDANKTILRVNQAFTEITGYVAEEIIGKTPAFLKSGHQEGAFCEAVWEEIHATGSWTGEIRDRRKDGTVFDALLSIRAVQDQSGSLINYVSSFVDLSQLKKAEAEAERLEFYDQLTDLPNRRLFLDRLEHALATGARVGTRCALLIINLDHFKFMNDTHGFENGDRLLKLTAERLGNCIHETDTLARFGADEFAVLLEDLSADSFDAARQAEASGLKIMELLRQPYLLDGYEVESYGSIGIAISNLSGSQTDELLTQADFAVYQAKEGGRNRLSFFDSKVQEKISERTALEADLGRAQAKGQLHLYFQPQVDECGQLDGAEALIRWMHPERGFVPASEFITLAEESDLILTIGNWILDQACARLANWQRKNVGRNVILSVNVSSRQLHHPEFVADVEKVIRDSGADPRRLKLEITESMLLEDSEKIIEVLKQLKAIGLRLSLDDFGTGYSSLSYLKRLPLDQLKIDQSFVRDIAIDSSDQAIIQMIIAMAQSLNLHVIAEGVETDVQLEFLKDAGCTGFQGSLFGKSMPIDQFEELLERIPS